jgi:AbrB family looped-hinge helix DNA binding protein
MLDKSRIGSKGQLVVPQKLRKKYGIEKGTAVVFEEEDGVIKILLPTKLADIHGMFKIDLKRVREELEKERSGW